MKLALIVLLLVALALAKGKKGGIKKQKNKPLGKGAPLKGIPQNTNCSCGYNGIPRRQVTTRIVGGTNATLNEYPFIGGVSLDAHPEYVLCGSTVITKWHAISAAHCNPLPREASLVLAEHNLETEKESKTVRISIAKFINHEEYDINGHTENDIALVVLAKPITFGPTIGPACFPKPDFSVAEEKVRIIGWGTTAYRGNQSMVLQKVDVNVIPVENCTAKYTVIKDRILCTYTYKKDACQGDSGGPVIFYDFKARGYTSVGVVSNGIGCAEPDTPAVNSEVVAYRDWILQKIAATVPEATTCQAK